MPPSGRDRRLDPRVADGLIQVEYVLPSPQVRDLSVSGMYLLDPRPLQMGQPLDLRLRLGPADTIHISGMVRRVDPGKGMAIEFIRLGLTGRRRIKDFIAQAEPGKVSAAGKDEL